MLFVVLLFAVLGAFLVSLIITYLRYLRCLKSEHREKWEELIKSDPLVGDFGVETRLLHGPVAPLISLFRTTDDYGDLRIQELKKKARIYFLGILGTFGILSILIPFCV